MCATEAVRCRTVQLSGVPRRSDPGTGGSVPSVRWTRQTFSSHPVSASPNGETQSDGLVSPKPRAPRPPTGRFEPEEKPRAKICGPVPAGSEGCFNIDTPIPAGRIASVVRRPHRSDRLEWPGGERRAETSAMDAAGRRTTKPLQAAGNAR